MVFAQDYQTVRSDFVHFFTYETNWTPKYHGLKIDSVEFVGGDSIFYNYRSIRENPNSNCFQAFVPSWLGEKVVVRPNGDNLLFNSNGDTILIQTQSQVFDTWNMFQLNSISYLEARVEGIGNQVVLDSLTEIKVIEIQAKDLQGQPVSHPLNGKNVAISKDLGILFGFDFYLFPNDPTQIVIAGIENPDRGIHWLTWKQAYDFQVGDEFHFRLEEDGPRIERRIQVVTDVSGGSFQRTIEYDVYKSVMWFNGNPSPETQMFESSTYNTMEVFHDVSERIISMPNSVETFDTIHTGMTGSNSILGTLHRNAIIEHNSGLLGSQINGSTADYAMDSTGCFYENNGLSGGTYITRKYGNGIGRTYWNYFESDGWLWTQATESLVYFKKGNLEWGEPYTISQLLSADEIEQTEFKLYPNPLTVGQPLSVEASKNSNIDLFSMDGKEIPIEQVNGTMKTDNVVPGIYLIRIETESGVSTQKLVVTD